MKRLAFAAVFTVAVSAIAQEVVTFEDLASPPPLDGATGLFFANGDSNVYRGMAWTGFTVVGNQYRVDPPSGPLFGLPNSGSYFVSNQDGLNGVTIATSRRLLGAWFGQNEYYGFGAGADQVTVTAFGASGDLGSASFDLPDNTAGQPEPLAFFDTSAAFGSLSGIAGYRIDRRELGTDSGHWVGDDFTFEAVPEPATLAMVGLALPWLMRRRRS
ncbi:MAG: PEP-CTERM sorting domain-containing protein [Fimbriimonadaceae bacterium]|nr:PEP-CTERM sorting domain-containing protein [Fimbriimonadaceae bacterium]